MANIKIPDLSQATNVQGSDLLVLEQTGGTAKVEIEDLYRGGAGIDISGNQISANNIVNIGLISDLNMVAYPSTLTNYIGYINTSTANRPDTSGSAMVILSSTDSINYGKCLYMSDQSLYVRRLENGVWGKWVDIQTIPKPTTTGWQVAFRTKGFGLVVLVPCDTNYYAMSVNSGAQAFIDGQGWVPLTNGTWSTAGYGTYYLFTYSGNEVENLTHDAVLVSITTTVTVR